MNQSEALEQLQPFSNLDFLANQVVEGFITGLHKSPFHGFSVEFAEHRLYNSGESVKNIDWKLYGRTDKLFVKRFEEETNLRCQLVLDASSSMYYPDIATNKIRFSVLASAALMVLLKKQRDAFGLSVFSDTIQFSSQCKSTTAHQQLIFHALEDALQAPKQQKHTHISDALHLIAEQIHRRSLVIIFSDLLDSNSDRGDDFFSALQHLKHNKHEVVVFQVLDKAKELNFEFENRPWIFVDSETGEEVKVQSNQIRESYLEQMRNYQKELQLKCYQYKIDYIEADIAKGFDTILSAYLIKRNKMV